jgi:hypothetical protein
MADYLILARVTEHRRLIGHSRFAASVSAIPVQSGDYSPESDTLEKMCKSRDEAREANERMIEELRGELLKRGDRLVGVKIE